MGWITLVKNIFGLGAGLVSGWTERKTMEAQAKTQIAIARAEANIQRAHAGQVAEIEWDTSAVKNALDSWKDEYLTILFTIPLILCFIPGMDVYVTRGFSSISETPEWYQISVAIIVASSFGYRKFADWRMKQLNKP